MYDSKISNHPKVFPKKFRKIFQIMQELVNFLMEGDFIAQSSKIFSYQPLL